MNIRQLEVFRAVVVTGGVAHAAEYLNISQPAVSRMIKNAGADLGIQLFQRLGGRLHLTDDGQRLFEEIDLLFDSIDALQKRIHDIRDAKAGSLHIVATPGLAHSVVPQALEHLMRNRPDVQVSLDIRRWANVVQHVQGSIANVGLALTRTDKPDLALIPIHMGKLVCVIPKEHPFEELELVTPAALSGFPLIMMTRGSPLGKLIANAFDEAGVGLDWRIETTYSAAAITLVRKGFGVALVDEYATLQDNIRGLSVKRFEPDTQIPAYLMYAQYKPLSKLTKLFIDAVLETIPK